MPYKQPVCSGLVDRIGQESSSITHKFYKDSREIKVEKSIFIADHEAGLLEVAKLLTDAETGVIKDPSEIEVVGHRVVHGGESFSATTFINETVKEEIKKLFSLAPLHNPSNFLGIEVAERIFTEAQQVAVFDTAYHQTMPEKAYRYAIPENFYSEYKIRAYGFHGTSHKYVSDQAAQLLNNQDAKIITIHLGNGCSMAAIKSGKVVDTSMGFGPLSGLVMGTRSGDIDPSVIFHLINERNYTANEVNTLLNKKSGMIGLSGFSDMRDVKKAIGEGNRNAVLAYDLYAYRIKKYIGSYAAVLNGIDAIVFTAGVGENDSLIRSRVCEQLDYLGIELDSNKNMAQENTAREINKDNASVKIFVVPTNEEWEIAQQCYSLILNHP